MKLNELLNEAPIQQPGAGIPFQGDSNPKEPKRVKVPDQITVGANPAKDGPIDPGRRKGNNAGLSKKLGNVNYLWMGQQWVVDNPGAPNNGQIADRGAAAQLGMPHVDELLIDIKNANVAHLVADYILGRERALDTSDMRSSAKGTRYDNQQGKTALDTTKPNAAINPAGNAKLAARTGNEPFQNATRDQY